MIGFIYGRSTLFLLEGLRLVCLLQVKCRNAYRKKYGNILPHFCGIIIGWSKKIMKPERRHRLIALFVPIACLWVVSGLFWLKVNADFGNPQPLIFFIQMYAPIWSLFESDPFLIGSEWPWATSAVLTSLVPVFLTLSIAKPQSRVLFVFAHISHTAYWLWSFMLLASGL